MIQWSAKFLFPGWSFSDLTYREWREKKIEAGIAFICRMILLLQSTDHDEQVSLLPPSLSANWLYDFIRIWIGVKHSLLQILKKLPQRRGNPCPSDLPTIQVVFHR